MKSFTIDKGWRFGCLVFLVCLAVRSACGCSCEGETPPKAALQKSAAVFTGRVISVRSITPNHPSPELRDREIAFETANLWKGPVRKRFKVRTPFESSMCGYDFHRDADYIVYAYTERGQLRTNICTRTAELRNATKDLRALGPPRYSH
jgi:hypothetical protein